MDVSNVLEHLRRELVHLDAAIVSLERLRAKVGRRRSPPRVLAKLRRTQRAPKSAARRPARRGSPTE
jgi:hypothetical protein